MSFLRPNVIKVERRSAGASSKTGQKALTTSLIQSGIPALVDLLRNGTTEFEVEGQVIVENARLFVDGLMPYRFKGTAPGGTVIVAGVTYTVAPNGLGAFVDVRMNDRITDERGQIYLVLDVAQYGQVSPLLQARLALGRAWA